MWCVFLKINQKVVEACVVVLLFKATLIFLDSLNFSKLSSSQEILKVRVDLFHALYLVVLNCKEHDFTRQTSLQVSLAINHTILLENLVASTLKLLFLIFEFRILIFRRIRGIKRNRSPQKSQNKTTKRTCLGLVNFKSRVASEHNVDHSRASSSYFSDRH